MVKKKSNPPLFGVLVYVFTSCVTCDLICLRLVLHLFTNSSIRVRVSQDDSYQTIKKLSLGAFLKKGWPVPETPLSSLDAFCSHLAAKACSSMNLGLMMSLMMSLGTNWGICTKTSMAPVPGIVFAFAFFLKTLPSRSSETTLRTESLVLLSTSM